MSHSHLRRHSQPAISGREVTCSDSQPAWACRSTTRQSPGLTVQDYHNLHVDDQNLISTPDNPVLKNLSIKKSPAAQTLDWARHSGNIMLARADGKDIDQRVVLAMWYFIEITSQAMEMDEHFSMMRGIAPLSARGVSLHDAFHVLMTPERFVAFFEEHRERGWEGVECPVKLGCCKACGTSEEKLMRCGKCGVAKYCGRGCQAGDWEFHKNVCVRG